jgi:hypothetical protein
MASRNQLFSCSCIKYPRNSPRPKLRLSICWYRVKAEPSTGETEQQVFTKLHSKASSSLLLPFVFPPRPAFLGCCWRRVVGVKTERKETQEWACENMKTKCVAR